MFVSTTGLNANPKRCQSRVAFGSHDPLMCVELPCDITNAWKSRRFSTNARHWETGCGSRESLTESEKVLLCLHSNRRGSIVEEDRDGESEKKEREYGAVYWLKKVPHRVPELGDVEKLLKEGCGPIYGKERRPVDELSSSEPCGTKDQAGSGSRPY